MSEGARAREGGQGWERTRWWWVAKGYAKPAAGPYSEAYCCRPEHKVSQRWCVDVEAAPRQAMRDVAGEREDQEESCTVGMVYNVAREEAKVARRHLEEGALGEDIRQLCQVFNHRVDLKSQPRDSIISRVSALSMCA